MVDENNLHSDMEEYKFQEESEANVGRDYEEPTVAPQTTIAKLSRAKRLFIPIILIVVIIIVYQLLSWYSNRKAQSSLQQEEVVAQKSVQNITSQPAPSQVVVSEQIQPVVKRDIVSVDTGSSDMTVQQKLDVLALRTESNTGQMEKLKDTIVQNQAGLVNLNRSVNTLATTVQSLNDSVQQLVAKQTKATQVKKVKRDTPPKVLYHVKAIVPGMAWLESSAGQTIAVRVGQNLPGYGVVRLISPKDGMVITSWGTVIQYGVNDF